VANEHALVRYATPIFDSSRWNGFRFRAGDIVISTPPKCGTTWTQMMCALLIFGTPTFDRGLDRISPWLDMLTRPLVEVVADLDEQTHRRFIKTHTPFDGLPFDERVTYLAVGRDPRDVALSWDHHVANADVEAFVAARERATGIPGRAEVTARFAPTSDDVRDRFWDWIEKPDPPSLASTLHHVSTFWALRDRPNVVVLHYGDLQSDLEGQMRALAARLDIEVPERLWPTFVQAASFDAMRARADVLAPDTTNRIWHDNTEFFHRGTNGQWREVMTSDADVERYARRVAELVTPDVSEWLHQGPVT
jgi:hypothetical protein